MNRKCSVHNDTCNCQPTRQSRRLLIGQGLAATTCGLTGWLRHQTSLSAAFNPTPSHASGSPADIAPADALKKLCEGNLRFASGKPLAENRDMDRVRALAAGQKPFAAFLGCADSRVPIEIVFDHGFGDVFVTRIAGNVACSENIGSLEFRTRVLGARVLYVLGHNECGAVHATIKGDMYPGKSADCSSTSGRPFDRPRIWPQQSPPSRSLSDAQAPNSPATRRAGCIRSPLFPPDPLTETQDLHSIPGSPTARKCNQEPLQ